MTRPAMTFDYCISGVDADRGSSRAGSRLGAVPRALSAGKVSKKAIRISGTVSSNGKTFHRDSDSKIWMVSNPEAFSGIKEFHVRIKAQ